MTARVDWEDLDDGQMLEAAAALLWQDPPPAAVFALVEAIMGAGDDEPGPQRAP
ncbi:hypothetical protein [Nocardiopsis ansamitocini]|uniref:Uncharacterized protein n=1 Tax=Nocardiopsis ansamitocini TaxID=1670832 RepID=A0A9W6UK14_9ACTN|nr:hypothetical protein [Nocardiopsis ansamitocini]GLU48620.1 hypothetical protein Nans01_29710 [Nocardiopsis ansamitocini]